ncbi:MAG: redox-sensing transcriptional repressor Rex [Mollicutes bacterium]|nr:redox-sensing transcriptional repressor Rex [Mollicutes bacterium]MDD7264413.1 redox-sensing transcriptional repressor Rex [bacterium]MDY4979105.1 redox-sensing transcriptional repressor Rex [Candidatus Onthovivens sp.]
MEKTKFTENQLRRMPAYLSYLKMISNQGVNFISCQEIALALHLNQEQVRKDIALISSINGVPNKGRDISLLIKDIETQLGINNDNDAIIVGIGSLGTALCNYNGFVSYGLRIVAGFDKNPNVIGKVINGVPIYDIGDMTNVINNLKTRIAIVTVPSASAIDICKMLVANGIEAIWNFAPIKLDLGDDVIITNMDMASSLATLSHKLYIKHHKEKGE